MGYKIRGAPLSHCSARPKKIPPKFQTEQIQMFVTRGILSISHTTLAAAASRASILKSAAKFCCRLDTEFVIQTSTKKQFISVHSSGASFKKHFNRFLFPWVCFCALARPPPKRSGPRHLHCTRKSRRLQLRLPADSSSIFVIFREVDVSGSLCARSWSLTRVRALHLARYLRVPLSTNSRLQFFGCVSSMLIYVHILNTFVGRSIECAISLQLCSASTKAAARSVCLPFLSLSRHSMFSAT